MGIGIAADDREIGILIAGRKAEAKPEPVGQRQPVVDRVARIDRIVLFAHVPLDDRAAVRGDREPHIGRSRHRPALEQRAQRACGAGGVGSVKADIVDEHQETALDCASAANKAGNCASASGSPPVWTSASGAPDPCASATAALTKADLPMPRDPQSSTSCAGTPAAWRRTFSVKLAFCASIPRRRSSGTACRCVTASARARSRHRPGARSSPRPAPAAARGARVPRRCGLTAQFHP